MTERTCAECGETKELWRFPPMTIDGERDTTCRMCIWAARAVRFKAAKDASSKRLKQKADVRRVWGFE